MAAYISRTLLPRYRVAVPKYMQNQVSTVYLGMPPLPIGQLKPIQSAGLESQVSKEALHANTISVSGIGNGGIEVTKSATGTTRNRPFGGSVHRRSGPRGKRKAIHNSKNATPVVPKSSKRVVRRRVKSGIKRASNGRFLKK